MIPPPPERWGRLRQALAKIPAPVLLAFDAKGRDGGATNGGYCQATIAGYTYNAHSSEAVGVQLERVYGLLTSPVEMGPVTAGWVPESWDPYPATEAGE